MVDFLFGQSVFVKILKGSNEARRLHLDSNTPIDAFIRTGVVVTVGRRYITVQLDNSPVTIKFYKDTLYEVSNYSAEFKLYATIQDIYDENEYEQLLLKIRRTFDISSRKTCTLSQLRRIDAILKE